MVAYYARTGDIHARRISDILPTSAWRAHEFYRHTTARLGFAYQLSLPLELDETTLGAIRISPGGTALCSTLLRRIFASLGGVQVFERLIGDLGGSESAKAGERDGSGDED